MHIHGTPRNRLHFFWLRYLKLGYNKKYGNITSLKGVLTYVTEASYYNC